MKVFISWSGEQSKQVALALKHWLRHVNQHVEPWISSTDIHAGDRWSLQLAHQLESTDVGILCITRENHSTPWILFEAGALAKKGESRVIPYLFQMKVRELPEPLGQFQAKLADKEGTGELVHSLNLAIGTLALSPDFISEAFEMWWPRLEEKLATIPDSKLPEPPPPSSDELLTRVLTQLADIKAQVNRISRPSDSYELTNEGLLDLISLKHLQARYAGLDKSVSEVGEWYSKAREQDDQAAIEGFGRHLSSLLKERDLVREQLEKISPVNNRRP